MLNLKKLKAIREKKGMSQSAISRRVGISQGFYNSIELNKKSCSLNTLAAIVQVLDINISDIWDASNDQDDPPILPVKFKNIVVEENTKTVRFILPDSSEAYQYITQRISGGDIPLDSDLKTLLELWSKISDEKKAKIIDMLREE